ncbi:MAG: hypothetical protein JSW50_06810 [Candidatus Latescibacterota bacterium]|nr:MAG: hypothetical protein JSW50_06810 [Candidatus Latescibacterota bacterium]
MSKPKPGNETKVQKVECPVCGNEVTFTAHFKNEKGRERRLVDFGCDMQGKCGIPSWDPCPFYVLHRENKKISK